MEAEFIHRMNNSIFLSGVGTVILALILGTILSRTITRPIRELTADEAALLDTYRGATDDGKALARSVLGMAQKPGAKARG